MKRWLQLSLLILLIGPFIAPTPTNAYSYGDADAEDVAETFKLVNASLSEATPDWNAAIEAFKVRRAEITSHFGQKITDTLDHDFEVKDAPLVIANFKAVLVMNLERRFSNAKIDIKDYTKAKVLLAKAKATFDTLAPFMSSNVSENSQAFEDALDALGNPGLFGVGKRASDPELFKQKVDGIYNTVKPLFVYRAYIKPAATVKPIVKQTPAPTVKATATPSATPAETTATASALPSATPVATETASSTPTIAPTEAPVSQATPEATVVPTETTAVEASIAPNAEPDHTGDAAQEAHAPMQQTDKTNPYVTILLIAGVIIIGGGAVWFAKRKGLF